MKDKATCLNELCVIDVKMNKIQDKIEKLTDAEGDIDRKTKMSKRIANLEKKKTRILIKFDISFRSYIEKLENRYHNTGVVQMMNALCPGCRMKLPVKEALMLQSPSYFVICSFCGRIVLSSQVNSN